MDKRETRMVCLQMAIQSGLSVPAAIMEAKKMVDFIEGNTTSNNQPTPRSESNPAKRDPYPKEDDLLLI